MLGGINIIIDYKRSSLRDALQELESLLQDGDKLRVRNQTDLLNAMSKLGFKYLNAYISSTVGSSLGIDDDFSANDAKARINMVFRKKIAIK